MRLELKAKPEFNSLLNEALQKVETNTLYFKHRKEILFLVQAAIENDLRGKFYWENPQLEYTLEFRDFKLDQITNLLEMKDAIIVTWSYRSYKINDLQSKD